MTLTLCQVVVTAALAFVALEAWTWLQIGLARWRERRAAGRGEA